jgi:hypothetical protein
VTQTEGRREEEKEGRGGKEFVKRERQRREIDRERERYREKSSI